MGFTMSGLWKWTVSINQILTTVYPIAFGLFRGQHNMIDKSVTRTTILLIASLILLFLAPLWGHEVGNFTVKHGLSYMEGLYIMLIPWFVLFGYAIYTIYKGMSEEDKGKGN
jgi:hypothetical protein